MYSPAFHQREGSLIKASHHFEGQGVQHVLPIKAPHLKVIAFERVNIEPCDPASSEHNPTDAQPHLDALQRPSVTQILASKLLSIEMLQIMEHIDVDNEEPHR